MNAKNLREESICWTGVCLSPSLLLLHILVLREHEKLKMEAEDLVMRTKEIQMLHVTKELQQVSHTLDKPICDVYANSGLLMKNKEALRVVTRSMFWRRRWKSMFR